MCFVSRGSFVSHVHLRLSLSVRVILRERAQVAGFDDSLKVLSRKMFDLMYAAKGVGLAAPQVGINKRLMVYNEHGDPKKWVSEIVLVNPEIQERSEATDVQVEGCLSFPGMQGSVKRSKWIKVRALPSSRSTPLTHTP